MSTKEEREFQISLAELSADIQTYLSIALALAGILIAYTIGLEQIYFSLPSRIDITALSTLLAIAAGTVVILYQLHIFIDKANKARKNISELRKKYTSQET
jgi:hypothetical protein